MPSCRLAPYLVSPALLIAFAPGCQVFPRSRPVPVLVRDADTQKPIPGARVQISYPLAQSPLAPHASTEPAGNDGIARLYATPYGDAGIVVQASAGGYLTEEKVVPIKTVEKIEPTGLFEAAEQRPACVVLELYTEEPPSTVELVLPAGYRGQVQAEVRIEDDMPRAPGQRHFRYTVPASGVVLVSGPDLFRHYSTFDFTARFADGPLLSQEAKDGEVGFWCLKSAGRFYTFFVGTRQEYELCRPQLKDDFGLPIGRKGGGGRGGHGGRGGRRGGQPSPDAGQP
jgi:hypothetical protein